MTGADEIRLLEEIAQARLPARRLEETDDGYACEAQRPDEPHVRMPRGTGATKLEAMRDLIDRLPPV